MTTMEYAGLTSKEAKRRLEQFGPNEIISRKIESILSQIKKIFVDPMGMMLLGLSILYWVLGDETNSIILFIAFFPVVAVDILLEIRADRALQALKATLSPLAKVIRNGVITDIPAREIVPGDILVFEEGQTIPADGKIIECNNLNINEASLTGESIPVVKIGEDLFFSGTTVILGRGLGLISQTGKTSKLGGIASLLEKVQDIRSPLRKKVDALVSVMMKIAIAVAAFLFLLELYETHRFLQSLIIALTLAMAAIPEEFPLVYTLYLSLGAWRLSKKGILVKSLPSVETLGSVDIICTDKTGTLTEGHFQLKEIKQFSGEMKEAEIWRVALMACEIHPVDSLELAIFEKGKKFEDLLTNWELINDYPFEQKGKHMSHVWQNKTGGECIIAMKGAVEGVLEHCALTASQHDEIITITNNLASAGQRILGLASRGGQFFRDRGLDERELKFLGFLVFSDPVRSSAKAAVIQSQASGIQIKMLTGDHIFTARAIAEQVGIAHPQHLFTGEQLSKLSQSERREAYLQGSIFARVLPEQKYDLIETLKKSGRVVAMMGDGINDAPALKLADIGISMGKNATDVARSSAQMVLLNNDFSGILAAVFEGRKILSNLRRSFSYLISFHVPIVLLALIPPILKWPAILLPVHIVILELIVHPISAFTFENLESNQKKRRSQMAFLKRSQVISSAVAGLILSIGALFVFSLFASDSAERGRTIAFATVLLGNMFFVLVESPSLRSRRVLLTTLSLLFLTYFLTMTGFISQYLNFAPIGLNQILMAFIIAALASIFKFREKLAQ